MSLALVCPDEAYTLDKEEKYIALLAHLLALLVSFFVNPIFGFIGPLIILLAKGKESRFVTHHAKEALNYQITVGLLAFLFDATATVAVISGLAFGFFQEWNSWVILYFAFIGVCVLLSLLLELYSIFIIVLACIRSYHGVWFRYPHCVRFVK